MIRITIKFLAQLEESRPGEQVREYPTETPVSTIVADLDLQENRPGIMLLNGVYATPESMVRDGDTLAILPLVDGG